MTKPYEVTMAFTQNAIRLKQSIKAARKNIHDLLVLMLEMERKAEKMYPEQMKPRYLETRNERVKL